MTAEEIIQQAVDRTGMADKKQLAFTLLKNTIRNLESRAYWAWLQTSTTHQTVNTQDETAFSASEFPAAALADYTKGMIVASDEPARLTELPFPTLDALRKDDAATGNPRSFAIQAETLYLHPKPVTSTLPVLTLTYNKTQVLPTATTDDIETATLIPEKYQAYLVEDVMSGLYFSQGNESQGNYFRQIYDRNVAVMIADNGDYRDIERARTSDRIADAQNVTSGR